MNAASIKQKVGEVINSSSPYFAEIIASLERDLDQKKEALERDYLCALLPCVIASKLAATARPKRQRKAPALVVEPSEGGEAKEVV
jgi:hypothetical protein